ncbi:tRNA 2-thiocytidine(32) synthetase TtcA, partial [bacterium]|nr:tRNA 2-thiocytidine(32) synthetase TtcA [bacterium]
IADTKIGPQAHGAKNRKNPCFLCARLRRQRLFEIAVSHNATKIALGHHKDDIIETFMLNILFSREVSTMLPKQDFFGGKFQIIRPLAYLDESQLKKYHREIGFPVFESGGPTDGHAKREYVKGLLHQMEHDYRGIKKNIYKAIKNVNLEYLPPNRDVNPR